VCTQTLFESHAFGTKPGCIGENGNARIFGLNPNGSLTLLASSREYGNSGIAGYDWWDRLDIAAWLRCVYNSQPDFTHISSFNLPFISGGYVVVPGSSAMVDGLNQEW